MISKIQYGTKKNDVITTIALSDESQFNSPFEGKFSTATALILPTIIFRRIKNWIPLHWNSMRGDPGMKVPNLTRSIISHLESQHRTLTSPQHSPPSFFLFSTEQPETIIPGERNTRIEQIILCSCNDILPDSGITHRIFGWEMPRSYSSDGGTFKSKRKPTPPVPP